MFGFILNMFIGLLSAHATASLGRSLASYHRVANSKGRIKCVSLKQ